MPKVLNWITRPSRSATTPDNSDEADGFSKDWQMPLGDAVDKAVTLLAFACRSGKSLAPEQIKPIIEMVRVMEKGDEKPIVDIEKEQAFWKAYSALVSEISPVTSDSINASLEFYSDPPSHHWRKYPIAHKTVFKHGTYSLLVLLSIIFFQSYLQMGVSVRDHLQTSFHSQKQSVDELFAAKIAEEDSRLKASGREGEENQIKKLYSRYKVELELAKLRASQDELYSWGKGGDKFLKSLGMGSSMKIRETVDDLSALFPTTARQSPQKQLDTSSVGPNQSEQSQSLTIKPEESAITVADNLILSEVRTVVIPTYLALNESEQILRLISEFVLPLLYGLLGACAYVLRDLTNSIRSVTFSKFKKIGYNLRLIMGPLVGIAVGLFLGTPGSNMYTEPTLETNPLLQLSNNTPGSSSLGTLAMAFLAGYSVEVLFSALDTLVSAFAKKNPLKQNDFNETTKS